MTKLMKTPTSLNSPFLTFATLAFLTSPTVLATFSTITSQLTSFTKNITTVAQLLPDPYSELSARNLDPRQITDFTSSLLDNINNYGCWCYFDADKMSKGRGQPMNEVDELCRNLHYGYECAKIDHESSLISLTGDECVPWEKEYQVSTEFDEKLIRKDCNSKNKRDPCAQQACIVERYFIVQLFNLLLQAGSGHDAMFGHGNGFDVELHCPIKQGIPSERSCCGEYPHRRPFKLFGGNRACCGDRTYSTVALECCSGDILLTSC